MNPILAWHSRAQKIFMGPFPHENFKSSCDIVENKVARSVSSTPPKEK